MTLGITLRFTVIADFIKTSYNSNNKYIYI